LERSPESIEVRFLRATGKHLKSLTILPLIFVVMFSVFAGFPTATSASESFIQETVIITYAVPPIDNSMLNPHYALLSYHWSTTIDYYVNPANGYGLSRTSIINTIMASANAWDQRTSFSVFSYEGTTSRTAGRRDGYNTISWGIYYADAIAVTYIWTDGSEIVETDCRLNTYYAWSLTGVSDRMDFQSIMTHEFGHWCGLKDLYDNADYWLTMYAYSDYGQTWRRSLGIGDIMGLRKIYGF
jgi:hypothetical protein